MTPKQKLYTLLGNRCHNTGCDVTNPDMLTVDHVQSHGAADHARGGVHRYITYLATLEQSRAAGHPDPYQLLCANHNQLKELSRRKRRTPPTVEEMAETDDLERVQIRVRLSKGTLASLQEDTNLTVGEVIEQMIEDYRSQTQLIQEIHAWVMTHTSLPHPTEAPASPVSPPLNPAWHVPDNHGESSPRDVPQPVTRRKGWLWTR